MSGDRFSFLAVFGALFRPGPGGQASLPRDADGVTLRGQVHQVVGEVLADPDPQGEWARSQLRDLLASHPEEPERALLEHLIATRAVADAEDVPEESPLESLQDQVSPVQPRSLLVPFARASRDRIRTVLRSRMLLTAFQPIRELPSGTVTGFEALTRFVSEDGASADVWFRDAAAVGLGPDLEIAALRCALEAARDVPVHLFVTFNLSSAICRDPRVPWMMAGSGLGLDRIIIDLAGRIGREEIPALNRSLAPLRRAGLRVAVDGSGPYVVASDLIRRIRPDIVKLDRGFLERLKGPVGHPDASTMIELALETGAALAAEGIETEEELAVVTSFGMEAGQGYLLGRPSASPLDWSAWNIQAETVPVQGPVANTGL
jgi:EAL domain-containing protein (putative c-di-GMP-specific phosphodiesterase class I)